MVDTVRIRVMTWGGKYEWIDYDKKEYEERVRRCLAIQHWVKRRKER